jgi:hypothetical protein
MKQLLNQRFKFTLWFVIAVVVVMLVTGTVFAAGEQLQRGAVESGGSTHSSNGLVMRDVIGQAAVGSSIAPSGVGLCSGFGCNAVGNTGTDKPDQPDDPDKPGESQQEIFMPSIQNKGAN